MKNKIKVDNLRLAGLRYYSKEDNGVLLSDSLAYVFLEKKDDNTYINIFDGESSLPVFERFPCSNSRKNGESYGTKMKLINEVDETGPCYVIVKDDLKDEFSMDEVTIDTLEKYVMKSKFYFKDRVAIAKKKVVTNPINYFNVLINDLEDKEKMLQFFEEQNYQYKKSR